MVEAKKWTLQNTNTTILLSKIINTIQNKENKENSMLLKEAKEILKSNGFILEGVSEGNKLK